MALRSAGQDPKKKRSKLGKKNGRIELSDFKNDLEKKIRRGFTGVYQEV